MLIRPRVAIACALVALPVAALVSSAVHRIRMRDLELATLRVVQSQVNDQVRERCESDPTWFLTGPLVGRPPGGVFVPRSDDDLPPRPRVDPQPFELFAYDIDFVGSSPATPRFPQEFRRAMRQSSAPAVMSYETPDGVGVQVAMPTGWVGSVCMYFLGRMAPPPNQTRDRILAFAGVFLLVFGAAYGAALPTILRIRRLARDARESVEHDFTAIAPDNRKDELSSITFVLNDSAQTLHERRARIEDLSEALRRFVSSTDDEVAQPLAELEASLAGVASEPSPAQGDVQAALLQAHDLGHRVANLVAAARLRSMGPEPAREPIDVVRIVGDVVDRHRSIAAARGVALQTDLSGRAVTIEADAALFERIVANVVDNAVRYNRPGGSVRLVMRVDEGEGRFRLWVTDTGVGVSDEHFRTLTAIHRFRGDEHRIRRPGAPGLGLAVAREACDRYDLAFDMRRPPDGGLEVEISGAVAAT